MGWECPACTVLNSNDDFLQCECCGSERPSPPKGRRLPEPGALQQTRQQAPPGPPQDVVDLLSEDEEEEEEQQQQERQHQQHQQQERQHQQHQQRERQQQLEQQHHRQEGEEEEGEQQQQQQQPPAQQQQAEPRMGSGGSKASGRVAVAHSPPGASPRAWAQETWDDDFQIQLSESLATTIRQLQQPGTGSVHKQAQRAEAAPEAVAAEAAAAEARGEEGPRQQRRQQPRQQQRQGKKQQQQGRQQQAAEGGGGGGVDIDLTGEDWEVPPALQPAKKKAKRGKAGAAAAAVAAGEQAQQLQGARQPANQGSGSSAHTAVVDAEGTAAAATAAAGEAAAPPSKRARLARAAQPSAAGAAGGVMADEQALVRTLQAAAQHAVQQAAAAKQRAAAAGSPVQQEQRRPADAPRAVQLPLQPSQLLGKRLFGALHPPLQPTGSLPLAPLPSMLLGSLEARQAQQAHPGGLPVNPSLRLPPRRHSPGGASPASGSPGLSPPLGSSPESRPCSPGAAAAPAAAAVQRERQQGGQQASCAGPQAWEQCVAALYAPAPLPPQQQAQSVQQLPLPPAAPEPTWVQRARQGPDITQALVAAAAGCPSVPLPGSWRQQQQQGEPAPVPGWVAFRVSGMLPQSAGCHSAADFLQVGAAAGAAAAAAAAADNVAEGGGTLRRHAGAQQQRQAEDEQEFDLSQVAARLLAGLTMQDEPYADLEDRSLHFFNHRSSALHRKLKRQLAPLLGSSAAGGSRRPPGPSGRRPSRLRLAGGAAGDGGEAAVGEDAAAAAARRFTGVRPTPEGRFTAITWLRSGQLWLGTYTAAEAAARAVDLALVYRWLSSGRPAEQPTFNLPDNRYLEDAALLQQLAQLQGPVHLKAHIKNVCGANKIWWQR